MMFLGKNSKGRKKDDRGTPMLVPLPSLLQWSSSDLKDGRSQDGGESRKGKNTDRCSYRCQLEEEVQKLQKQLQEGINLHIALTNATRCKTTQTFSSCNLPDKVMELLSTIASLESIVTRLEVEIVSLNLRLNQERSDRHFADCHLMEPPSLSHSPPLCSSDYPRDANVSPSRGSHSSWEPCCSQTDIFSENRPSPSNAAHRSEKSNTELKEEAASCSIASNEKDISIGSLKSDDDLKISFENLWKHPNSLSEEMVRCMRNIYLRLSKSSTLYSKHGNCYPTSPPGHLSGSSLATFSGSSVMTSSIPSPSAEFDLCHDTIELESTEDPYRVNWKESQVPVGAYSSAAEVSWMTVGRKQLEYAAEALKRFRFLVEQLEKVNPSSLSCEQRMAFWINLYNALIMHAYLAYGVPRSETKLFSLMQKASYTVGGQSVSAIDIEYVLLKMKPPAHRPQIALILTLHKFESFEEHQKFSVDASEPLVLFALSCGMQSSPVNVSPSRGSHSSWEPCCSQTDIFSENRPSPSNAAHRSEKSNTELKEEAASCSIASNEKDISIGSLKSDDDLKISFENLWKHPNSLSEEMVRCMRNIYLRLSKSSTLYSKHGNCYPTSPPGHLSGSSLATFSGSSVMTSSIPSPSAEFDLCHDTIELESTEDPYRVNWKESQVPVGAYSSAAEVSWMTVGRKQLEYAAEALKRFRFLVEQLEKVNPSSLSCEQRMAFWINLYNALIMHAYLAYGVPRSETKLFSLMQKASYTVGGQSVSAIDIEYVLLKMKPPAHRPQIALILTLHKFESFEEHQKFSVDASEPLVLFALSCGMQSSPVVRIFTPSNMKEQLQNSMRDYVRASVGINDKGKLLIPRLLHFFANGAVEDSLLVDWVCQFLSAEQVSAIRGSTTQWKQRLMGVRSFIILPFDSRFRYLFFPEAVSFRRSSS